MMRPDPSAGALVQRLWRLREDALEVRAGGSGSADVTAGPLRGCRCPVRDDVVEVVCELAGNAICHTRRGQGGKFEVRVERTPGVVSVTVADGGSGSEPRLVADPLAEHGRGLRIVHALSAQVTVTGGKQGRLVRADVPWTE